VAAGCSTPPAPTTSTVASVGTPTAVAPTPAGTTNETGSESPASPSLLPAAVIEQRIKLGDVFALAAASTGVWYLRGGEGRARVGRAEVTGSVAEADAGPLPVSLAASDQALYVLEGMPTQEIGGARTDVIERLDPHSLKVVASTPIPGLGTDVALAGGLVWVVTADGGLFAFDMTTVQQKRRVQLLGRGSAQLAGTADVIWILNGQIADDGSSQLLLHHLNTAGGEPSTLSIGASTASGTLTVGQHVWVGGSGSEVGSGQGALYRFALDSDEEEQFAAPRSIALAEANGWLWWATPSGEVAAQNEGGNAQRAVVTVGATATDMVASGGRLWVASDDLVILRE
jgi:outer membrane protein assembly factor BamB